EAYRMRTEESDVECTFLLVGLAFVGGEVEKTAINVVVSEKFSADIDDIFPVHNGANEVDEGRFAAVGPFWRRRQSEAKRREAGGRRVAVGFARQVVDLVEDDESKAIAEMIHVQIGRIIGRNRDRFDAMVAAADDADRPPKRASRRSCHWRTRSRVGATTSVERGRSAIAIVARWVFPAPVGSTTTPRRPVLIQAASASSW
ncbi:hypothetical protein OUZ56_032662, partial [Daphnia magna]